MPPNPKIVQLRQQLAERLPGLRTNLADLRQHRDVWQTGLKQIDSLIDHGLHKSAITEIVAEKNTSGSALLLSWLLRKAAIEKQIFALVDGQDCFDPTRFDNPSLSRLLWVRCKTADQALKGTDLLLRDRNLPLVLLDLQINPATQLRRIPSSTWYRLQRIVESSTTVFIVVTPRPMVGCAQTRLKLHSRFGLSALQKDENELLSKLKVELTHHRLHVSAADERAATAG